MPQEVDEKTSNATRLHLHCGHTRNEVIIPHGDTEFQPEDKVIALVKRTREQALREML